MLEITPIPAFSDNYIWALTESGSKHAAVVDPGESEQVLDWLATRDLQLTAILITHKHSDHTGGVAQLRLAFPEVVVYGPANETIRGIRQKLQDGEQVTPAGFQASFSVMELPGHTEGHIGYYGEGCLFCGDVLFAGGCGRLFGGTAEQMHQSLQRIAELPADTKLYCAHEYTEANLGFGVWVEPENTALVERVAATHKLREANQPSVPSLLGDELKTNPFLRTDDPQVRAAAEKYAGKPLADGAEVFAAIRSWKDHEYD